MVKSIIVEEEGHLEEMILQLERFDTSWKQHAERVAGIEHELFNEWIAAVSAEVSTAEAHQLINS